MATIYFFNDRPRQAVEAYRKTFDRVGTADLLLTQGRRRDVLALEPGADKRGQGAALRVEQGALAYRLGDEEQGKKLFAEAMKLVEARGNGDKEVALNDFSLGRRIRAGKRLNKLDDAIIRYIRRVYNLMIGERTAEEIKIKIGSAYRLESELAMEIRGRYLISGGRERSTAAAGSPGGWARSTPTTRGPDRRSGARAP